MSAQIIPWKLPRNMTEAECRVIHLAERADMAEREKMMIALAKSVALLKEIAKLDGRK